MIRSLAAIVDSVEENRFFGRKVPASALLAAAREIASRHGLPGSYAGMFAPTGLDFRRGIRVFTGEPMRSRAGVAHILGEECCRLLLDVKVKDRSVSAALARAEDGMLERLNSPEKRAIQPRRVLLLRHLYGIILAAPGCGRAGPTRAAVQGRPAGARRIPGG